jgi:protocatechuate 3,4-dioxygenase beta subunit
MKKYIGLVLLLIAIVVGAFLLARYRSADGPAQTTSTTSASGQTTASATRGARPGQLRRGSPLVAADDPQGSQRLEGQVVDGEERPVRGAVVAISAQPPRVTETEADGSFAFEGLMAKRYSVDAHKGDAHGGPVSVNLTATSDPVLLRLEAVGQVVVTVLAATTRSPLAAATVELRGIANRKVTTDQQGRAVLGAVGGSWHVLKVAAPGYAPAWRTISSSGEPGAVVEQVFLLEAAAAVSGRVVDGGGNPLENAYVLAQDVAATGFAFANVRDDGVVTDKNGRWQIAAVAPGTYRFSAMHAAYAPGLSVAVRVDGRSARRDILITLEAGGRVAGKVQAKTGGGVASAQVRIAPRSQGLALDTVRQVYSDAAGNFEFTGLPRQEFDILAVHESASSELERVDLVARVEAAGLVLTLDGDGAISGIVVDANGEAMAETQVVAQPDFSGGEAGSSNWRLHDQVVAGTDAGGRFVLRGLGAGRYRLHATRGNPDRYDTWLRDGTLAAPGDEGVKVVLVEDGRVEGKVSFADGSAPELFTVAVSVAPATSFSKTGGAFVLKNAPPGRHSIVVRGPEFREAGVRGVAIAAGGSTDVGTITVQRGRSISGRVVRADGTPQEGAEVVAGKQLMGDGNSLSSSLFGLGDMGFFKKTTSGADGSFVIHGVGARAVVVAAEHPATGRSNMVPIAAGASSVSLELVLQAAGALEGTVVQADKPVQGAMVMASSQNAARGILTVVTGTDGAYRFDKLAPDRYVVSASLQQGGLVDMKTESVHVTVEASATARADIVFAAGSITLEVDAKNRDGSSTRNALVFLLNGRQDPRDADELLHATAQSRGPGGQSMIVDGRAARFAELLSGEHTACAVPLSGTLADPAVIEEMQNWDSLPLSCQPTTVQDSPALQRMTIVLGDQVEDAE